MKDSPRDFFGIAILVLTMSAAWLSAEEPNSFSNHAFFKLLVGKWTAEGELKGTEGNVLKIKEEWIGAVAGDNSFTLEGTRDINGNSAKLRWSISRNGTTGLFEVTHVSNLESGESQHFEATVSEDDLKMELSGFTGNGSAKVTIVDSFPTKDHDAIDSKVTFVDDSGATALTGSIKHQRVKTP